MAQPPDYGSYVKREPRQFNMRKFIKVAIIVTLILALIEVVIIFFFMNNGKDKKHLAKASLAVVDTIASAAREDSVLYTTPPVITTIDTASVSSQAIIADTTSSVYEINEKQLSVQKPVVPEPKISQKPKPADTAKPVAKPAPVEVELSKSKMQSILESVRQAKGKSNSSFNCVQIRKTNNSNVTNAFKLAEYLKDRGYIIGGRLTVPGNVSGVRVSGGESCITVTIGTL